MKRYVLDASALMTFFEDRAGAGKVEELLGKAAETKRPLAMSVVNWGEVYYSVWRARGEKAAEAKLQEIAQLPIEIVGVDLELGKLAARLKPRPVKPRQSQVIRTFNVWGLGSRPFGSEGAGFL